jgi:hypothetical protein
MYHPDQHYQAHALHLKELYEQAEQRRMIASLAPHRPARIHATGGWFDIMLVRLGTRLWRSATSSRPNLEWCVSRKPDGAGPSRCLHHVRNHWRSV